MAGVLLAPKSGKETREELAAAAQEAVEKAKVKVEEVKEKAGEVVEEVKQQVKQKLEKAPCAGEVEEAPAAKAEAADPEK